MTDERSWSERFGNDVTPEEARAAAERRIREEQRNCECRKPHVLRSYLGALLCLLCGKLRYA